MPLVLWDLGVCVLWPGANLWLSLRRGALINSYHNAPCQKSFLRLVSVSRYVKAVWVVGTGATGRAGVACGWACCLMGLWAGTTARRHQQGLSKWLWAFRSKCNAFCIKYPVAEWLALVTLIHVLQRTGGSRFEPWFELCSYWWILGEFSSGVYPTDPRFLTCWSTDPNSNLSPVEKPPRYGIQLSCCPWGHPRKTNSKIIKKVISVVYFNEMLGKRRWNKCKCKCTGASLYEFGSWGLIKCTKQLTRNFNY